MSDMSLRMLLFGEDKTASKALKGVGDQAEHTSKRAELLGKAVGIGLGGVGVALGAMLKTGWGETKDAAAGTAQLAAGIKSTGNAAGVTVDGLNALAGSIQGYSGQTDDSIVKSEQLLLTFTNIRNHGPDKIFDQATRASADMAAKMGGDASQNAILLGKALNDPVKGISALTRVGVSFSDGQKKTIAQMVKTGDTIGAQKVILHELNTEFGGAAKAAGESLPGQMARARRSFEDSSQALVTALLPAFNAVMKVITGTVLPNLSRLVTFFTGGSVAAKLVMGAIGALTTVLAVHQAILAVASLRTKALIVWQNLGNAASKAWAAGQWLLNAAMRANPIGIVITVVVALIAVIVLAYRHSARFRAIVQGAFNAVKDAGGAMWRALQSSFRFIVEAFLNVAGAIIHGAASAFGWVPGIGGRLRGAARAFDSFRDQVNWSLGGIRDRQVQVTANVSIMPILPSGSRVPGLDYYGNPITAHASGGQVGDGLFTVGEEGWELMRKSGSNVQLLSNPQARRFAHGAGSGGSGGGAGHTVINLQVDGQTIARATLPGLQRLKGQGVRLGLA
jgi:hypothetical protein